MLSCNKEEVVTDREVPSFAITAFNTYDGFGTGEDIIVTQNGKTVITGLGVGSYPTTEPFVLQLDAGNELEWAETPVLDNKSLWNRTMSIIENLDGAYTLLSYSDDSADWGLDFHLTTYQPSGTRMWGRQLEGFPANEISRSFLQASNGDYIVLGKIDNDAGLSLTDEDKLVAARTDKNGALIWYEVLKERDVIAAGDIVASSDSTFVILSAHRGVPNQVRVRMIDGLGNTLWEKPVFSSDNLSASVKLKLIKTNDGGYLASFAADEEGKVQEQDAYLVKLNEQGDQVWSRQYGGNRLEFAVEAISTNDGNFVYLFTTGSFGAVGLDLMLVKVDQNGAVRWEKKYGGPSSYQGRGIVERPDGSLLVLGDTNTEGYFKFFLMELDAEGNAL